MTRDFLKVARLTAYVTIKVFHAMDGQIQIHSCIREDGTLYLEGLHQMAGLDVTVVLSPAIKPDETGSVFTLEEYAMQEVGIAVVEKIKATRNLFKSLSILDGRSPQEILDYDEIGLPR